MTAPMHVWKPALNQKRAIRTIAVGPTYGDKALAEKLDQAIIGSQPKAGNAITLLHPKLLEEMTQIQLASFDGQPSDVAGINAARRANADVLLQGQILLSRTEPQEPKKGFFDFRNRPSEMVTVAWTVTDVASGERLGEHTIRLDREKAEKEFPDLALMQGDNMDRVITALSRKSWSMFSPMTQQKEAVLCLPWLMPGSGLIRKGNGYAKQGRWDLAEESCRMRLPNIERTKLLGITWLSQPLLDKTSNWLVGVSNMRNPSCRTIAPTKQRSGLIKGNTNIIALLGSRHAKVDG